MGLEEADRQEERPLGGPAQQVDRDGGDVGGPRGRDLDHLVVADHVRLLRDVLLADQHRVVAGVAQRVHDVLLVVVQRPAPVGEAEHPVGVGVAAGEQAGAAGRARRGGAERLAEEHALLGEPLDARRVGRRRRRAGRGGRCRASAGRGCSAGGGVTRARLPRWRRGLGRVARGPVLRELSAWRRIVGLGSVHSSVERDLEVAQDRPDDVVVAVRRTPRRRSSGARSPASAK